MFVVKNCSDVKMRNLLTYTSLILKMQKLYNTSPQFLRRFWTSKSSVENMKKMPLEEIKANYEKGTY